MRPNLSFQNLASTLAALGTTALLVGCGGEPPKTPVDAQEVAPAGGSTPGAAGQASCGAGHTEAGGATGQASCGGKAGDAKPEAPAAATTPAAPATGAASTDVGSPSAMPAHTADKSAAADPKKPADKKPAPGKADKKPAGQASCGAGTCSADPKKAGDKKKLF